MKTSIVVIEDEFYTRKVICRYCALLGEEYKVVGEADNGQDGLALLTAQKVDIAIVDINIPILNGLEMIEAAIAQGVSTKMIILTGYSEFRYAQSSVHLGVSDYLLKPLTFEALQQSIGHIARMERRQLLNVTHSNKHVSGFLRRQLATQLLNAQTDSVETELLRDFVGFPAANGLYTVLNFQVNNLADLAPDLQTLSLKLSEELKQRGYQVVYAQKDTDTVSFVLYAGQGTSLPPLETTLREVGESLFETGRVQMKFSLSAPCAQLEAVGNASLQADLLQKSRLFYGEEPVIILTPENQSIFCGALFTEADRRQLRGMLQNSEKKEIDQFLENKFASLQEEKSNANSVYFFAAAVMSVLYEMDMQDPENAQTQNSRHIEDVFAIPHLEQLKQKITDYAHNVLAAKTESQTPYLALVKKVQAYIEDHIGNPELCLEQIAHACGIGVQYLCFIYRQQTDTTIGETIFQKRMDRAVELIEQGETSTSALTQACGYNDTGYFSKCFRKMTGLTPRRYIDTRTRNEKAP